MLGLISDGLRGVAGAIDRVSAGRGQCGDWCAASASWAPDTPDSHVCPVRIGEEPMARMLSERGWEVDLKAVLIRESDDGTLNMLFRPADEFDMIANRSMQRMVFTALDLASTLDLANCDLPDDVVVALSEFKKASRSRQIDVPELP